MKKIFLVSVGFLILFTSLVWATGITVSTWGDSIGDGFKVRNNAGGALDRGRKIQFITDGILAPDPRAANWLTSGLLHDTGSVGSSNTGVSIPADATGNGEFDYYYNWGPGTMSIRVWETLDTATSFPDARSRGAYTPLRYGIASRAVRGSGNPPDRLDVNISTDKIADIPPAPTITTPISVSYVERSSRLVGYAAFIINSNSNYELASVRGGKYGVQVRKRNPDQITYPDWSDSSVINKNGDGSTISLDPNVNPLDLDATYQVRACARNYFNELWNTDNWSDPVVFTTAQVGGGGTEVFNLVRARGMGLNTIYMPFSISGMTPAVTNWDQLIRAINDNALVPGTTSRGYNTVQVIGRYVPAEQKWIGYIVTYGSSTLNNISGFTPINTTVQPSDPTMTVSRQDVFWVSVLEGTDFTITGSR